MALVLVVSFLGALVFFVFFAAVDFFASVGFVSWANMATVPSAIERPNIKLVNFFITVSPFYFDGSTSYGTIIIPSR